ncbi:MAG TPA: DUF3618 domain-containing protein [Solirubrobacteraceae bacterium]|jgi:hypothetical protein|nr:DUF3618 domain-containing protein [Solirubrobacteraceae bacterium]
MPTRTPDEIRASIEQNRQELGESLAYLRDEVTQLTDWRAQLRARQSQLLPVAVVAGFVAGGGLAGLTGLITGRGRRQRRRSARLPNLPSLPSPGAVGAKLRRQ